MCSLRGRVFVIRLRLMALSSPRRGECLLALMLLFCNMAANFLAML